MNASFLPRGTRPEFIENQIGGLVAILDQLQVADQLDTIGKRYAISDELITGMNERSPVGTGSRSLGQCQPRSPQIGRLTSDVCLHTICLWQI